MENTTKITRFSRENRPELMTALENCNFAQALQLLDNTSVNISITDNYGRVALHYAAENADKETFSHIFTKDPSLIDCSDVDGYTPLTIAVMNDNLQAIRFLLDKGADINHIDREKHSLVQWATVCDGDVETLETLLNNACHSYSPGALPSTPDLYGAHALHYAIMICKQNPDKGLQIVRTLLKHGSNVNCADIEERTPLLWAASSGSLDALISLLQAGADKNSYDHDGLNAGHCAAGRGHCSILEWLYRITPFPSMLNAVDRNGATPLCYAVSLGHLDCVQLLLHEGLVAVNHQDRRLRSPAHYGAAKGQLRILKLLNKFGASFEIHNYRGDLPLHEAVQSGSTEVVTWLHSLHPSSINTPNYEGRTALHIAAVKGNMDLCILLCTSEAFIDPVMLYKNDLMTPLDLAIKKQHINVVSYLIRNFYAKKADQLPIEKRRISKSILQGKIAGAKSSRNQDIITTTDGSSDVNEKRREISWEKRRSRRRNSSKDSKRHPINTGQLQKQQRIIENKDNDDKLRDEKSEIGNQKSKEQSGKHELNEENEKHKINDSARSFSSNVPKSTSTGDLHSLVTGRSLHINNQESIIVPTLDSAPYDYEISRMAYFDSGRRSKSTRRSRNNKDSISDGYLEERHIFQELANLKRIQMQYGKVQEKVLVRRMVDNFCRNRNIHPDDLRLRSFDSWERFLHS